MTNRAFRFFVILLITALSSVSYGHLGEQHAPGEHRYFPDIPRQQVPFTVESVDFTNGSWWTDAHAVPNAPQNLMLGSRFQSLHLATQQGKSLFLQTGEDYRWSLEGMSAFEFHPGFSDPTSNGYGKFYTITTEADSQQSPDYARGGVALFDNVLSEWTLNGPLKDVFTGTSRELIRIRQSNRFHNVNDLEFDDQGNLFIALGEDNGGSIAQRLDSIYGKILRIDPFGSDGPNGQYGIPADNPFVNLPGALGEIYATGLRNPWRIAFDSATQQLWAFDVGDRSIEEVNRVVPAGNYGWPLKEGTFLAGREVVPDLPADDTGLTTAETFGLEEPTFQYDHLQGSTVIGGFVYRGEQFPWLAGKVIFADHGVSEHPNITPRLLYGDPDTNQVFELLDHEPIDAIWGVTCNAFNRKVSCPIYSVNQDADGEILLLGKSVLRVTSLPADFDNDGLLTSADIDLLSREVASGRENSRFDVDQDGDVDASDRLFWVHQRKGTFLGDANLDGQFDTGDLLLVFQAGLYEDAVEANASWVTGDWDGDQEFTSSDLLRALQDGGYQDNVNATIAPLPEPSGLLALPLAVLLAVVRRQRRNR